MSADHPIRIDKKIKPTGVVCFQIFGLNLFAVNKFDEGSDLEVKFIASLIAPYETICLIGSPAPENWMNDMRRQGKVVSMQDFWGKETLYRSVPVWYYGGQFGGGHEYGPSFVFPLRDQEMLTKLSRVFMGWDAVALLLYEKAKDGLRTAQDALATFTREEALVETILRDARYLILTQADCQYLEVYTRAPDVEPEVHTAAVEIETYIKSTAWYQKHKASLVWDETELCYVMRATT